MNPLSSLKDLVLFRFYFFRLTAFKDTLGLNSSHPPMCSYGNFLLPVTPETWLHGCFPLQIAPCTLQEPPCLHWWCRFLLAASPAFSFWIHWRYFSARHCLQYAHSKLQLNWKVLSSLKERVFLRACRLEFIKFAKLCNIIASPKKSGSSGNYSLH